MPLQNNDVIAPFVQGLFDTQLGEKSWGLYYGPVVVHEPDRYSPREKVHQLYTVFSKSPDSHDLWIINSWPLEPKLVPDHTCFLPLRYEYRVYQEAVTRAKGYLLEYCCPYLPPAERINAEWVFVEIGNVWAIKVGPHYHTFGSSLSSERHTHVLGLEDEKDPIKALAAAVAATNARRFA